jgi:hypothetical protein
LAIEQPTPDVPLANQIELDAPTEAELCTRGAVKLRHIELTELKMAHKAVQVELRAERQRTESLTSRLNSTQTEFQVLKASLTPMRFREIILRIIELVILVLLSYAIDFEKAGNTKTFVVFLLICVVLVILIFLIQGTTRPQETK